MSRAEVRTAKLKRAMVHLDKAVKTTEQRRGELQKLLSARVRRLGGSDSAATPGFTRGQQIGLTMKGR